MAAVYHVKLCRAILVGFHRQLQQDGTCKDGFAGMLDKELESEQLPIYSFTSNIGKDLNLRIENDETYKDDLTGQLPNPALVRAARAKELEYFESKEVWELRPADEARRRTGKPPVTVRWVDVAPCGTADPASWGGRDLRAHAAARSFKDHLNGGH